MRTFTILGASLAASTLALMVMGCGDSGPSADDLNQNPPMGGGQANGGASTTGGATTAGTGTTAGSGTVAGSGGSAGSSVVPQGGSGGSGVQTGGSAGMDSGTSGAGGGSAGAGGAPPTGPYAPRTGTFKMLVYSKTAAFRHDASIKTGKAMLQQIGQEQGFEVVITETNELITPEGLKPFEIIFFMNSTGDIFNATEQKTYEDWMVAGGAFAGAHAATDTENGWAFYSEVTGQYYNGHGAQNVPDNIQIEAAMLNHPAVKGLPNPWQRNEEWYKFDSYQQWSAKPGFQILGRKTADTQPITWIREWGNFRAFYTGIGHDPSVFQDPNVKKHLTGGIMWAVRREALIK
jgi:type 1 glutamine amidotransferase